MTELEPARGFEPNWSTHPGEHIEEYLETKGWSQAELARRLGVSAKLVSEIVNKKNPVTPETAIALERVLGLKAYIWLNLQSSWDLFQARQKANTAAPEAKSWLERFPIKDLKKQGRLPDTRDKGILLDALLRLLEIATPAAYEDRLSALAVHHRRSSYESSEDHIFTWLQLGEIRARQMQLPEFDEARFFAAVHEIRRLTQQPVEVFEPRMKQLCAEAGVALILEKPLGKTRLFGSARWFDGNKRAIIQMSLRMKSNDHFWWTFFHECGHIALHRGQTFADDQSAKGDGVEKEADDWAEKLLYGPTGVAPIVRQSPRSNLAVEELANRLDLHPGIIVGMLQHYKALPPTHLNGLKEYFKWADEVEN